MRQSSQQFVLPEVHPLNYVSAIVEHSSDVFRVHGTCEMRVAVMSAVAACCADSLQKLKEKNIFAVVE